MIGPKRADGARCRVRTCKISVQHKALTVSRLTNRRTKNPVGCNADRIDAGLAVAEWRHAAGIAGDGSRFCERKSGEVMMTRAELLKQVLQGVLLIVVNIVARTRRLRGMSVKKR